MTVYELIQELTQYPADDEVTVCIFGETKSVHDYVEDARPSDTLQLSAEPYCSEHMSGIVFVNCELNEI